MAETNQESVLAFTRLPHEGLAAREVLEGAIVSWLDGIEESKRPRILQYFENASYLAGNHLTRFYYTAETGFGFHQFGTHDSSGFDSMVAKTADNRLLRPVETVLSMLTGERPKADIEPNSDLPEDEDAADLAKILLDLVWERPLNMQAQLRKAVMIGLVAGTACVEIEYGPTNIPLATPRVRRDDEAPGGFRSNGYDVTWKNDIQARVWTPFHITPDPTATSADEMSWVARTSYEDAEWVKENFDVEGPGYVRENAKQLKHSTAYRTVLYWWYKFQDILDSPQYYQQGAGYTPKGWIDQGGSMNGQVKFTVLDVKPSSRFPRGRTLILAEDKLIYAGDARAWSEKYPWRWHPYSFWGWYKLPGRFWHMPLLSELVPLQKRINSIDVLVQANRQFMAIGQWLIPKHSKVPEGYMTGTPGQNIPYTDVPGMSPPTRVDHRPLPAELLGERDLHVNSIDTLAASSVLDQMQVSKSAARAGVMLQFLREERLRSKGAMLQEFQEFVESIAQHILIELQVNMTEADPELNQRIRQATRDHSSLALRSFTGASLRDHHAVKIDIMSAAFDSRTAREARALEYLQTMQGQVTPEERAGILKAIGVDEFVKNVENASVESARRIISRIVSGQLEDLSPESLPGLMMPAHNARVMAEVFGREQLRDRFHDLSEDQKVAIVVLRDLYAQKAEQERIRQLQEQIAIAQATGGKPA